LLYLSSTVTVDLQDKGRDLDWKENVEDFVDFCSPGFLFVDVNSERKEERTYARRLESGLENVHRTGRGVYQSQTGIRT
jgi:hypothetical protein